MKSPRTISVSRRILGSYWIASGAEATSVPPSRTTATESGLETRVSTCAGENITRAAPEGASDAGGAGVWGAVAGGAIGGAVAGGAASGGAVVATGAVTG